MINSHYVPRFILKKFSDKLSLYNIHTGELTEDINVDKAYSQKGFYDDDTEKNLNLKLESQFGNLLANKLLKAENKIELNRAELRLVKKFILISTLRSLGNEPFLQKEKQFYKTSVEYWRNFCRQHSISVQECERGIKDMQPPFEERQIPGETPYDYWMRTLKVILDTDGSPQEILNHPDKTYPAYRWSQIIAAGYLAFWDSEYRHDEFVITDIGMTSENEKGWNRVTVHNSKKLLFLIDLLKKEKDSEFIKLLQNQIYLQEFFHENFEMYPISASRMIVEISPFYKFRQIYSWLYKMPELKDLTELPNENLYAPNYNNYKLPLKDGLPQYHPDDLYIYDIKKLTSAETRYCNELFLDRINTHLGFSSLRKAIRSIVQYKRDNSYPYTPRVDYTNLYKIIEERYGGDLNV
ncbi:MAG: DUF4238 domain-containing protein [Oscillospiraceae bacterium]